MSGTIRRLWRVCLVTAALAVVPAAHVSATVPPSSTVPPSASNDLMPENNDLGNCVGTVESANCGSRNRADGHTYLVFLALAGGLAFIGWRISRGVRARDAASRPTS